MVAVAADTSESCSTYNTLCSISHEKKTYLNYNTVGQLFKIIECHRENKKKKYACIAIFLKIKMWDIITRINRLLTLYITY